ncbi:MAG: hypothetical protein KFB95_07185 [Simkaniaceae bacterium]|nr:MAG: hypothetical protein KFB95_07185 [Simkaniaceae bacterium]
MKRVFTVLIALSVMLLNTPAYANDEAFSECEYGVNDGYEKCEPLGHGSSKASHSAVSASMVGWGLGLAIAIAIVAGVLHQSVATHSSSNGTPGDSSS